MDHPYDVAISRALFLKAMLVMSCGDGGEAFRGMNEDLQEEYMAAMSHFSSELCDALPALMPRTGTTGTANAA